jgi:formylglycine-generating enzyme required for sulfatase activity
LWFKGGHKNDLYDLYLIDYPLQEAMMQKYLLLFLVFFAATLDSQTITNVRGGVANGRYEFTYDLEGMSGSTYIIYVNATDQQGNTIRPTQLSGDITEVTPGKGKVIWWEPQLEGRPLQGWTITLKAQVNIGIQWIYVEGGTFSMGGNGLYDGKPIHTVTVSSFDIGATEVTFDQYDMFCEATGATKPSDEGWGRGKRPVINVSWHDAIAFLQMGK